MLGLTEVVARRPAEERATSVLLDALAIMLQDQGRLEEAELAFLIATPTRVLARLSAPPDSTRRAAAGSRAGPSGQPQAAAAQQEAGFSRRTRRVPAFSREAIGPAPLPQAEAPALGGAPAGHGAQEPSLPANRGGQGTQPAPTAPVALGMEPGAQTLQRPSASAQTSVAGLQCISWPCSQQRYIVRVGNSHTAQAAR